MTRNSDEPRTRLITAVDLFCGAGGLTCGLRAGEIDVVAGIDVDPTCAYAYQENNGVPFLKRSVAEIHAAELEAFFGDATCRLLAGCAPCQPFSAYTQGRDNSKDEKWGLLSHFGRLVNEVRPELVTMENVPQLQHHAIFRQFVETLKLAGYSVSATTVFGPDYGIPQARTRLVLLASRLGPIRLVPPTHEPDTYPTVGEIIRDLPPLAAGEAYSGDPLHRAAKLSELNLRRIRASSAGGTWEDWDPALVTACHRSKRGDSYKAVYGRMSWKKPAPTMTTQCYAFGSGRFGHPEQDRAITLREAALLQTFPETYKFIPPGGAFSFKRLGDLIGNAVPVMLGRVIAESLHRHLDEVG